MYPKLSFCIIQAKYNIFSQETCSYCCDEIENMFHENLQIIWYSEEKMIICAPASVVQFVGASSHKLKGCKFSPRSGHIT